MRIGIIGGGASGMAAALAAAENPNAEVILLERQARVGRKLQATGNGRCNLSNLHAMEGGYHGDDPKFREPAMEAFPVEKTLAWFRSLGLYTVSEPSGRVYPYSDQANSVVDVLRFALEKPNIQVKTGFEVDKVRKSEAGFTVTGQQETWEVDRLIIACGGLAGTKLGGGMFGYRFLRGFGHRCTKLRPTLVQLKTDWPGISALKGVRANADVQILCDGKVTAHSVGEIQFTEIGLSGPVMFEVSRDACQGKGQWTCSMDFLPDLEQADLEAELLRRQNTRLPASELLTGILHNRLGRVITQAADITQNQPISALRPEEIREAAWLCKHFEVSLTEPLGMDSAQVTAGGILTGEFDPRTMESRLMPGLYACGEVLDIDGDCGGYNLQWAWSSGRLAGTHAGKDIL